MTWGDYCGFRDAFAEVIDSRYYTLRWLDEQILTGKAKFWSCVGAGLVTEIRDYPTGARDIHTLVAAGDMDKIVNELRPEAEEWARAHGCIASLIESRSGWAKVLKSSGYEAHQQVLRKEL